MVLEVQFELCRIQEGLTSKEISMRTAQLRSSEGQLALQDVMQCCSYGFAVILNAHRFLLKK